MKTVNQKKRKRRAKSRAWQHKVSILAISGVIVLLAIIRKLTRWKRIEQDERIDATKLTISP